MSVEMITAIYARLAGTERLTGKAGEAQVSLASLLATDPDTGNPSVFCGTGNDAVRYPSVTYRQVAGGVEPAFDEGDYAVSYPLYDFEAWEVQGSAKTILTILETVQTLLDDRFGAPPLTLSQNIVLSFVTMMEPNLLTDKDRNAWYGLLRFRGVEAR